jgi:hypothetical protein
MDPITIASLVIGIGLRLTEAYERHQAAAAAIAAMLKENRPPSKEEVEILKAAGADVDARLDELLG